MNFETFYWTITGFWLCLPVIAISLFFEKKNKYFLRLTSFIIFYALFSYLCAILSENYLFLMSHYIIITDLMHIVSILCFVFCNKISPKKMIAAIIWALNFYYFFLQIASFIASLKPSDVFIHSLFWTKLFVFTVEVIVIVVLNRRDFLQKMLNMSYRSSVICIILTIFGKTLNDFCFRFLGTKLWFVYAFQIFSMLCVILVEFLVLDVARRQEEENQILLSQRLWEEHRQQFQMRSDYAEKINKRFHDIKYEISAIKLNQKDAEVEKTLDSVSQMLKDYSFFVETGNPVIDTILTEKAELLKKYDTKITCFIDKDFDVSFIEMVDLYVMLGNAMDNVLDCVSGPNRPDKAYVNVRMYKDKGFVRIGIKNNYNGIIEKDGELPLSSKQDKLLHGYGIRSINSVAQKYNGAISVETEKGEFSLKIMIPIK